MAASILRFALLALSLCAWASVAAQTLVLNNTNHPPYSTPERTGYADLIAIEAFRRVGVQLRLVELPPERGLINANAGLQDGDLTRIAGLETQYPNLLRVPEKFIDWEFAAFGRGQVGNISLAEIRRRPVAHIRGWKIYERQLENAPFVTVAEDEEQLFRLLDSRRVEHVLFEHWLGLALIRNKGLANISPRHPAIASREMFIYLHKRHASLVEPLAAALRALKREGFYEQAYRAALQPYRETLPR